MVEAPGIPETPLTPHDLRKIAVEAGCDPRTVRRYLDGEPVVSTISDRVRRALDALGHHAIRRRGAQ